MQDRAFRLVAAQGEVMQARSDNIAEERSTFQSKHQLLVEAITDYAIYMLDRNGIITSWNAGAERFKGYTEDEIIGEHFSRYSGRYCD